MENQDHTQREALDVARRLSTLQQEKEGAVSRQDFELAAELRERELECRSRLHEFHLPPYVIGNLHRQIEGPATRLSPLLDLLKTEPGAADTKIVEQWPATTDSPLSLAFAQIPQSASGTLRAVLKADDVFSRYFEPMLPVLSAETFTKLHPDRRGAALTAMFHELDRLKQRHTPAVLSLVAPTSFLDAALQSALFRGLKEARCDFVLFEHVQAIAGIVEALQPEIALVLGSSSQ